MNNFDGALNAAKEAEKIITRSYEVYFVLAEIYFYKEMFLHAHESIQKAIRLNKNEIFLKEWYAKILYELGEYEKAEKVLAGILPDVNPNSDNYNLLGKIMLQLERLEEAEKYFNKSLQINPEDKIALAGINRCSK
jgi:Tfp pilus assembly protein PilF